MSRTSFRHQIGGYDIELDLTGRDYGLNRAVCFVRRGNFVRSIHDLVREGCLAHVTRTEVEAHEVPADTLTEILTWVRSRGLQV